MAKKPRGGRGKQVAKPEVSPRTAHPPARTLVSSSSADWNQGAYGRGPYSGKQEAAFQADAFQTDAFQVGGAEAAVTADTTAVTADTASATVPILIAPTIYPQEPGGTITVQNYITINIYSNEFRAFEDTMGQLLAEMRKSNEIAGEVRDKLNAEISAGMTILKSPKPDRRVIEVWLLRPLKYIMEKAVGAVLGKLAGSALEMLIKMIG